MNSLVDDLATLTSRQLEAVLGKMQPEAAQHALIAAQGEARERCAQDGLWFLRFVRTRDEADPEHPVKPFPWTREYVQEVWHILTTCQQSVFAKSRQMLMSWEACAFCVWWARFKPHQAVYWQSQDAKDAYKMVAMASGQGYQGRCEFIESHLPGFLQQSIRTSEGRIQYPNGSIIQALPGGADQIRSSVFSLLVEDEFAFQEEAEGTYTAAVPLIQKGAKLIVISTPNGDRNMFSTLYHGHPGIAA